jgi:GT2 family glycosyltransferase
MEQGWRDHDEEILALLHDDLLFCEPAASAWERVLHEFNDPAIGLVGFLGAKQHGSADIYRRPFHLQQLGRTDVVSNLEDAEVHGSRISEPTDVAILDGMALIVRRQILERWGGWPIKQCEYVGYDQAISCETRRQGYRIRVVPINVLHMGGQTSIKMGRADMSGQQHEVSHKWIYRNYADVLPWRCP